MQKKYNILMRGLHWVSAILIIALLGVGVYMANFNSTYKYDLYALHKSFGIIILFVTLLRIITRLLSRIPKLPSGFNIIEIKLSNTVYFLMYLLTLTMGVSGYLMSDLSGYPVKIFNFKVFSIFNINSEMANIFHSIHIYSAYILIGIISLHILATIKHIVVEKVNLLPRIT
jgi:cytochrome b561